MNNNQNNQNDPNEGFSEFDELGENSPETMAKKKETIKIVIIVAAILVGVAVGLVFYFLYSGNSNEESSDIISEESTSLISGEESEGSDNSLNAESSQDEQASSDVSDGTLSAETSQEPETSSEQSSEESSEEVSEEPDHGWVINQMGYTYLYYGAGYNQFNGTKATAEKYAAALNQFTNMVSFPVYSIIAPTSVAFVDVPYDIRESDDFYNSSQKSFVNNVNAVAYAKGIDVYTPISEIVKDEYLYFRTDKNWTADAAYYAYVEFCNATGNIAALRTAYEMGSYTGYLGNFYNATYSEKLKANADTVNYYKINAVYPCNVTMYRGGLAYKDRALIYTQLSNPISYGYYAFLGDRGETFTITSQNSATEKSLLVVGDSSAFAFVPYLVANYRNVYFVNTESYKGKISEYIADKTIDEAVVLSYATNAANASYVNGLGANFQ